MAPSKKKSKKSKKGGKITKKRLGESLGAAAAGGAGASSSSTTPASSSSSGSVCACGRPLSRTSSVIDLGAAAAAKAAASDAADLAHCALDESGEDEIGEIRDDVVPLLLDAPLPPAILQAPLGSFSDLTRRAAAASSPLTPRPEDHPECVSHVSFFAGSGNTFIPNVPISARTRLNVAFEVFEQDGAALTGLFRDTVASKINESMADELGHQRVTPEDVQILSVTKGSVVVLWTLAPEGAATSYLADKLADGKAETVDDLIKGQHTNEAMKRMFQVFEQSPTSAAAAAACPVGSDSDSDSDSDSGAGEPTVKNLGLNKDKLVSRILSSEIVSPTDHDDASARTIPPMKAFMYAARMTEFMQNMDEAGANALQTQLERIDSFVKEAIGHSSRAFVIRNVALVMPSGLAETLALQQREGSQTQFLFHGTKANRYDNIANHGFLLKGLGEKVKTDSGFYGAGIYGTPHLDWASVYVDNPGTEIGDTVSFIVALALPGKRVREMTHIEKGAPFDDKHYDSYHVDVNPEDGTPFTGGPDDLKYEEYVFGDSRRMVPLAVVTLRRVRDVLIWRDAKYAKSFENQRIHSMLQSSHAVPAYAFPSDEPAIACVERKKNNCVIHVMTQGGYQPPPAPALGEAFLQRVDQAIRPTAAAAAATAANGDSSALRGRIDALVYCGSQATHEAWAQHRPHTAVTTSPERARRWLNDNVYTSEPLEPWTLSE